MIYQLPTGEVIDIPLEEYLATSDNSFDSYIRSARYRGKFNIQLSHEEYKGSHEHEVNWDMYMDDNEIILEDNRTLNQILDSMPDEEAE